MRVIALGQQKGGVGKSAASINLACIAAASGAVTALIDMDTDQATTMKWGKRRENKDAPIIATADTMSLAPLLQRYRADGVQWAFLDLPGRNAPIASAGLMAADLILVPSRPSDVDVEASVPTVQAAKRAGKRYAYLMNISPPGKKRAGQVAGMLEALGHPVAPHFIVLRSIVSDSISRGLAANEANPTSESANEFKDLFEWIKAETSK